MLRWPLSKRKTDSSRKGRSTTKASRDSESWSIYRSCRELPLSKFIDITLNKNLSLLDKNYNLDADVSPDRVPSEFLLAIWAEINLEYTELMDNGSMKTLLENTASIELLRINFNLITSMVEVLTQMHVPELVDILKEYGYNFQFDPNNPVKYQKDLARVLTQAKALIMQIKMKEAEARAIAPKEEAAGEATQDDWEDSLIALSDDAGYPLDPSKITVYQYTSRYKNLMRKFQSKIQNAKIPHV